MPGLLGRLVVCQAALGIDRGLAAGGVLFDANVFSYNSICRGTKRLVIGRRFG
jgi:hypothetical protein